LWVILILACATTGQAAILAGTSCTGQGPAVSAVSYDCVASGSDRLLVAGISWYDNGIAVTAVTYGAQAMTLQATSGFPAPDVETRQYYRIAPLTGTQTFQLTFSGSVSYVLTGVTPYTGVHQTTPVGTSAESHTGGITTHSVNVTSAAGQLVVDTAALLTVVGVAPGAGQTQQWSVDNTSQGLYSSTEAGAASVTMSWSWTNPEVIMLIGTPLLPAPTVATRKGAIVWFP
jgi:hypothetical protein